MSREYIYMEFQWCKYNKNTCIENLCNFIAIITGSEEMDDKVGSIDKLMIL